MVRIIVRIILVLAIFNVISLMIPDSFIAQIDSSISYFVGMQYSLQPFINVSTLIACEQLLIGFFVSMGVFVIAVWMNKIT